MTDEQNERIVRAQERLAGAAEARADAERGAAATHRLQLQQWRSPARMMRPDASERLHNSVPERRRPRKGGGREAEHRQRGLPRRDRE